jgi:acyl-CoA synthetase (AMP-forming)/AMP-acid ligase II
VPGSGARTCPRWGPDVQIGDLIRRAARWYGDRPCLVTDERTVGFAEFDALTDRLGHALLGRGLAPGDRVAVLLPNGIDGVVTYYALAKAGLVRVPLNARETAHELAFKLEDSQARALVVAGEPPAAAEILVDAGELPAMIAAAPDGPCDVRRDPDAPLRLAYTGGTTGKPKAVVLTTRSELAEVDNFLVDLLPNLRPDSVMLHAAPITHGSGAFFLPHLIKGAANVVLPKFSAPAFLAAASRHRATTTFMVPTMIAMLLEDPGAADADLALERLCYGGAPIATSVLARGIEVLGPVFAQLYGQAEAPLAITCLQPWEHTPERLTAAGKPYTFVEVDIRDVAGRSLGPDEVGEILTRGPHTMHHYWRRPEATAETLEPDGWLHTGDIGRWDAQGYLHLLDRRHDVIISGGFNVYPREVEDALLAHPAVSAAAVVGLPDDRWGERVAAAVVTRAPVDASELVEFCAGRLAGFKRPRSVQIWAELPTSAVGKSLRREVRDRMAAATPA